MRLFEDTSKRYQPKHILQKKGMLADRTPKILIAAGIITLLAAGAIMGYGFVDDYMAGQRAQAVLIQMRYEVYKHDIAYSPSPAYGSAILEEYDSSGLYDPTDSEPSPATPDNSNPPETQIIEESAVSEQKYETIGILSIPKLALELPVLNEYSNNNLKVSVCKYEGEVLEHPERLVIAGHNYKSHFGKLLKLLPGDKVCFQNNNGKLYSYTVTEITDISMYDHEALEQGKWDITLFTCDSDRSRRVLVRCTDTTYKS